MKEFISHKQYQEDIALLVEQIQRQGGSYDVVYGVPRGGYFPAIEVGKALNIPVTTDYVNAKGNILVVDDLADSGNTLKAFSQYDTAAVYIKKRSHFTPTFFGRVVGNDQWLVFPDEKGETVEDNIRRIFQAIGEDPDREGLKGTPDRMVRMFKEIFRGYDPSQKPKITTFPNGQDGIVYDSMVIDDGKYYSLCEHHCRTFFGRYWFAYIPNPKGRILGISKIGRVVDYCASKLQVQERLTHDIVEMLTEALGTENPPLGMALVMKGRHMCKESRGARKEGEMTSSFLTGFFKENASLRAEFMNLIKD